MAHRPSPSCKAFSLDIGRSAFSQRRCLYSTLLTNIGPVLAGSPLPRADRRLVVGGLTLENVEFVPLVRLLQCVGISVSTYAGKMSLGMGRYDCAS